MYAQSLVLSCRTERAPQFLDITDEVKRAVAESTVQDGLVTVFVRDPYVAIKINEHEPLLLEDLERLLVELGGASGAPRRNGAPVAEAVSPAAVAARARGFLGSSETIPLIAGRLEFGRWQRLFLIELDRPGSHEIVIQVVGV